MYKLFELIVEIWGWLKIVASPFIAGLFVGGLIYLYKQNSIGLIIGIVISACGLIVGVIWATRIWKKHGTNKFLSQIMATPDFDKKEEEKN